MERCEVLELSKLYKRVLNVEVALKRQIANTLQKTYPGKEFNRLLPFLKNKISHQKYFKKTHKNQVRDKINDIISSNDTQEVKLLKFLRIAYLSDTLKIITEYKHITKDKAFRRNFYPNEYNHMQIQGVTNVHATNLNKLRNTVMHFNFNDYYKNKNKLIKSLIFWERLLYCPNSFMYELPPIKPETTKILRQLANSCPGFWNMDDRVITDMFDDLALLNGKSIVDLPSFWSIGREIYRLKREYRQNNT